MADEQFIKGKARVLAKYVREKRTIDNAIAGKGFSFEPGWHGKAVTDLETETKFALSDLNYAILQETAERELKQSGSDYDLAFKNAVVAWEQDKAALFTAWAQELANMNREDSVVEEQVKHLALEVSKRAVTYINAKEAIALEIEGYRKQIAELDGTTSPYEVQLANAKLLTAQKKLELLPYIEQLITLEWEALGNEQVLANKEVVIAAIITQLADKDALIAIKNEEVIQKQEEVIDAEEDLVAVNQRLLTAMGLRTTAGESLVTADTAALAIWTAQVLPATETLLTTMGLYVTELATQLTIYEQIADVKSDTADIKEAGVGILGDVVDAQRRLTTEMEHLTASLEALASYKDSELSPAITDLVTALNDYVSGGTLDEQVALKQQIATTRAQIAGLITQKVAKEAEVADAEEEKNAQRVLLANAKFAISNLISENRVASAEQSLDNIVEFASQIAEYRASILEAREAAFAGALNYRSLEAAEKLDIRVDNQLAVDEKQIDTIEDLSEAYKEYREDELDTRTSGDAITARLNHLLDQS